MSNKETITQRIVEAGGRLHVKSALNPALWMCAIITMPLVMTSLILSIPLPLFLQILASIPVIIAGIGYLGLLAFDRDKLQSEDYQIRKQSLELIQEKGDAIPISSASIEVISNPEHTALSKIQDGVEK